MAELTINADEITAALQQYVEGYTPSVGTEQVGRIVEVGDGIARVTGLPGAAVNEILEFEDGTEGLALNLDEETIGAVILGDDTGLEEEQLVKATGRILSVKVGDALLGRVVNALGEPVDGKGPLATDTTRRLEVLRQFVALLRGTHVHHPRVDYFEADTIAVRTAQPAEVQLDGDCVGTTPAVFQVKPGALQVLTLR